VDDDLGAVVEGGGGGGTKRKCARNADTASTLWLYERQLKQRPSILAK
jgi:hypothetical protein